MVAVMDRTMDRSAQVAGRAISEAAAARVVDDIIIAMIESGLDHREAKGIAYAAHEFLVASRNHRERARAALTKAGYKNGDVDTLLSLMDEYISSEREFA